ncbi:hypothetical protein [Knoellia koreensis]|uniref:Uncharacterized protein n=1 Tax=Knoellia koreensis TaxID=2730921 RepID=A0A849H6Q4_9MICO|nr:hypothetical protein [Knoellia sp. DB2414S]NNM45456.1 hypothetical protein [Knoellia sp. DB2414S]
MTNAPRHVTGLLDMAPHADSRWVEDFVVEQRLLGVPGAQIGDALATVEEHLVATGEDVTEAFGPAKAYARELADSAPARPRGIPRRVMVSSAAGLLGLVLLPRAVAALLEGGSVEVRVGDLVALGLLAALMWGLFAFGTQVLRALVGSRRRVLLAALAPALLVAVMVGVFALLRAPLVSVPAWLVGGLGLLATGVATWLSAGDPIDLVESPDGRTLGTRRTARWTNLALFPVLTVLMCVLTWVTWASS